MSSPDNIVCAIGLIASALAAVLWFRASLVEVPNNVNAIAGELQRIGRLNAWGAFAASVAAVCAAYTFWSQTL
jgi:hypothetical protein